MSYIIRYNKDSVFDSGFGVPVRELEDATVYSTKEEAEDVCSYLSEYYRPEVIKHPSDKDDGE